MADLQPVKNQLIGLSYEDKIQISEWLHTQIDLERNVAVKAKTIEVGNKLDNFLTKALKKTSSAGSSLMDQFRKGTESNSSTDTNKQIEGEKK